MQQTVTLTLDVSEPKPLPPEASTKWDAVVKGVIPEDVVSIIFLGELLGVLDRDSRPIFTSTAYTEMGGMGSCEQSWSITTKNITLRRDLDQELNESWQHVDVTADAVTISGLPDGVFLEWGGSVGYRVVLRVGNVPATVEAAVLAVAHDLFNKAEFTESAGSAYEKVRADLRRERTNVGGAGPSDESAMAGGELPHVINALMDDDDDAALGALDRLDSRDLMSRPDVLPGVLRALAEGSSAVRTAVAKRMTRAGRTEFVKPLVRALKDRDSRVREEALLALGDIGDPSALAAAAACLTDGGEHVRWYALVAIGKLASDREWPRVEKAVVRRLKDKSHYVRGVAISMLVDRASPGLMEPLTECLWDSYDEVRREAVRGLWKLKDPKSVPALITVLRDDSHSLRGMAAAALADIRDPRAVQPLRDALERSGSDAELRKSLTAALAALGAKA